MIDVTSGFGAWVLLLAGFGESAVRPPVEASKPQPTLAAAAAGGSTNSGGPGGPVEERGTPAPAAEPAGATKERPGRGIWAGKRGEEQPKPLLPMIAGEAKPIETKPAAPAISEEPVAPTDPLDRQVDEAIDVTARRVLSVDTHTPWQIGHGMLAFRRDYVLRKGEQKVNAYEWVATNPTFRSRTTAEDGTVKVRDLHWFQLTRYGARPQKYTGTPYEFEGHPNQFLAFFALARLPLDFEFTVQGRKVTYGDMLRNAKMEVTDREEVAWDLWAFAYYFDPDETWTNAIGEPWSMERLVATTMRQFSITKSPCGGCHALFALASARNAYLQTTKRRPTGVWTQADQHLQQYIAIAKQMQNRDGSFSASYFKNAGYSNDPSKRISTTGHTLEFLMLALRQDELAKPWVKNAVNRLSHDLVQYQREPLEVGGMYHAVHALVLYRERTRPQLAAKTKEITPAAAADPPATVKVAAPLALPMAKESPLASEGKKTVERFEPPKKVEAAPAKAAEPTKLSPPAALPAGEPKPLPTGAEPKKLDGPVGGEPKPLVVPVEKAVGPKPVEEERPNEGVSAENR